MGGCDGREDHRDGRMWWRGSVPGQEDTVIGEC